MNDKNITVQYIKDLVKEFCEDRDWDQFHNPKDLAIGISTEANELLDIFRFKSIEQMDVIMTSQKKEHVEEEVADILYFVLRFAQMNDIDLSQSLRKKLDKNNQKYTIEKSKGNNKKYNEKQKN